MAALARGGLENLAAVERLLAGDGGEVTDPRAEITDDYRARLEIWRRLGDALDWLSPDTHVSSGQQEVRR
jgi:hypothetical protein